MATRAKSGRRDAPVVVNKIVVGGLECQLGDLRKADFANIHDPKAAVNSIQQTLIAILNILRGAEDSNA